MNINGKNVIIVEKQIHIEKYICNDVPGYDINISMKFLNNDTYEQGYMNLSVGYESSVDISNFINKKYEGVPFDENHVFFEIYDTEHFYDTEIESPIIVEICDFINNKIKVKISLNDELVKLDIDEEFDYIKNSDII
jgi:hypothetical protein